MKTVTINGERFIRASDVIEEANVVSKKKEALLAARGLFRVGKEVVVESTSSCSKLASSVWKGLVQAGK